MMRAAELTEADMDKLIIVLDKKWRSSYFKFTMPEVSGAWDAAGESIASTIGGNIGFIKSSNPAIAKMLRLKEIKVIEGTTSTLARRLRSDFLKSVTGPNVTAVQLRERIEQSLTELKSDTTDAFRSYAQRAKTIAQTEVAGAANASRYSTLKDAEERGILSGSRWGTSGRPPASEGGTVRDSHFTMDGQVRSLTGGDPFKSGAGNSLKHPLDPGGIPKEVINCQCGLTGILKEL